MVPLLHQLERRLRTRIAFILRRGEVSLASAAGFLQLKGLGGGDGDDEQFDDVPLWQQYGLTSRPPIGTEVLTANLGGLSEEAIAIASDSHDHRPADLDDAEVVLYGKSSGPGQAQARCKPDGTLALACATGKFVEVGGASAKILKGEDVISAFTTWLSTVAGILNAPAGPYVITAANTALLSALNAALATKGKVS